MPVPIERENLFHFLFYFSRLRIPEGVSMITLNSHDLVNFQDGAAGMVIDSVPEFTVCHIFKICIKIALTFKNRPSHEYRRLAYYSTCLQPVTMIRWVDIQIFFSCSQVTDHG